MRIQPECCGFTNLSVAPQVLATGCLFCHTRRVMLGCKKTSTTWERKKPWKNPSTALSYSHISTATISPSKHKNCSRLSVVHSPAGLQERVMAICLCGIPAKRCNASSRRKVPRSNLLFYFKPSMTTMCLRYGTNLLPFRLNIRINTIVGNVQCIPPITSSLVIKNVAGSSVSQQKSYLNKPRRVPTDTFSMNRVSGAVLQGKHLRQNMDSLTAFGLRTRLTGRPKIMPCIWRITIRIWNAYKYQRRPWRSFIGLLMNILESCLLSYETLQWAKGFPLTSLILLSPGMTSTSISRLTDFENHNVCPYSAKRKQHKPLLA